MKINECVCNGNRLPIISQTYSNSVILKCYQKLVNFSVKCFLSNGEETNLLLSLFKKKSHTCEEDGAQLRISFWHLLMNLKNK